MLFHSLDSRFVVIMLWDSHTFVKLQCERLYSVIIKTSTRMRFVCYSLILVVFVHNWNLDENLILFIDKFMHKGI